MKISSLIARFFAVYIVSIQFLFPQNWEKVDSVFNPSGVYAFSFASPSFADMNGDGKMDLFVGNTSGKAHFFFNTSPSGITKFAFNDSILASIYTQSIGTNAYYPVAADLNGDGKMDLVIGGYNGFLYYENHGDSFWPVWTKIDSVFAGVNPLIGTDAKPVFVDIDNDGDLDLYAGIGESLFGGPTAGITIGFRNTGSDSIPVFTQDNTMTTGIPDAGLNSYPAFADIDADGDYDLLLGRDLASFLFYRNTGTASSPVWTRDFNLFNTMETTTYWKNPVLFDYDNDYDYDLIYGSDNGRLTVYQNTGTPQTPVYSLNTSYFRVIKNEGSYATASLADIDNDGDADLISGIWSGLIKYFRNTGGKQFPAFTPASSPLSGLDVGSYSSPVFVDLDSDGDLDVVSGELNGKLYAYINTSGSFSLNSAVFSAINVTGFSHPAFADLDADGDPDLILGAEVNSNWRAYRNQGNMTFQEDASLLTGATAYSRGKPCLYDIDLDGDYDLIIGRSFGEIAYFENKGTPQSPAWQVNDTVFAGIKVKQNASPAFADMDGDGKPDMIIAEYDGNFTWFRNKMNLVVSVKDPIIAVPAGFALEQNYPNPFNPETVIRFSLPSPDVVSLDLISITGEVITVVSGMEFQEGVHKFNINMQQMNLAGGMYVYRLRTSAGALSGKMVYLK